MRADVNHLYESHSTVLFEAAAEAVIADHARSNGERAAAIELAEAARAANATGGGDADGDDLPAPQPLFLMVSYPNVHVPLNVPAEVMQAHDATLRPFTNDVRRTFAALTIMLDEAVANLTNTLDVAGLNDAGACVTPPANHAARVRQPVCVAARSRLVAAASRRRRRRSGGGASGLTAGDLSRRSHRATRDARDAWMLCFSDLLCRVLLFRSLGLRRHAARVPLGQRRGRRGGRFELAVARL